MHRDSESEPESESTDEADGGPKVPPSEEPKEEPPARNSLQITSTVVLTNSTAPAASITKGHPLNTGENPPSKPVPSDDAPGDQESNLEDISPWDSGT